MSNTVTTTYYCTDTWQFDRVYNGPHTVTETCVGSGTTVYSVSILSTATVGGQTRPLAMAWTDASGFVSTFTRGCGGAGATSVGGLTTGLWMDDAQRCRTIQARGQMRGNHSTNESEYADHDVIFTLS